jgi:hypothetical protein
MLEYAKKHDRRQDYLILALMAKVGLSDAEIVGDKRLPGLRVGDIDFAGKTLRIAGNPHGPLIRTEITVNHLKPHDRIIPLTGMRLWSAIRDLAVAARIIRPVKKPTKRLVWAPSLADVDAILKTALKLRRYRDYLIVRILAMSGIREAELVGDKHLLGLRVKNVNHERKILIIHGKRFFVDGKPEEQPIHDGTLSLIAGYARAHNLQPDEKLFNIATRQVQRM